MLYCGSKAYGTVSKDSDIDLVAVFSDLGGITHAKLDGMDIFAYGLDSFIQRQSISDDFLIQFNSCRWFLRAEETYM